MRYVNKIASISGLALAVAIGAGSMAAVSSTSAQAQQAVPAPAASAASPLVIGLIDPRTLMQQSTAAKAARTTLDQRGKQLNDDAKKREDSLNKQAQLLDQQKATMTPQDYQAKWTDLLKQRDQARSDLDSKARALENQRQQVVDQIQAQALDIMKGVIAKRGITLLLNREAVPWANSSVIDITPDVLAQLNQKLPSVKF